MGVWLPERAISLAIWQWLHLKAHANLQAPLGPIHMFLWWTTKPHTSPGLSYLSHSASSQAVLLHRPPCPVIPLITHRIFPCPTSSIWPWSVYFFFTRLVQRCLWLFSLYYLQQKPDPWLWSGHFGAFFTVSSLSSGAKTQKRAMDLYSKGVSPSLQNQAADLALQKNGSFVSSGFWHPPYLTPNSRVLSSSTQLSFSTYWVPLWELPVIS